MNKYFRYLFFLLPLYFLTINAYSQSDDSTEGTNKVQYKISINHNSAINYYGRTDSLRSSAFFPMAEVWFTPEFYINAAPVFVSNVVSSFNYAGTVTTAGYQFNSKNKLLGNAYLVKPFYKDNSELVQSALKAQTGMNLTFLNKALDLTIGGDIKFSDNIDFGVTGGLDHIFRCVLPGSSILVADPSAYVYAGTQQFTKSYYKKRLLPLPGNDPLATESVKKFYVLSYEISIPVIFAKGKFQGLFTPAYVIPQNLIKIPNRPDLSERGKEMFYATIGVKMIL